MALASGSAVSARHLSFIETGRARPSREMVLHLADRLEVPLRERNRLLLAAGHAPVFPARSLGDDEDLEQPYPAVVVDRGWNLVLANRAVGLLTEGVAAHLLEPPANALRVTLHPEGMAPRIENLAEWSGHLLRRLRRQVALGGDAELARLHDELAGLPGVDSGEGPGVPTAAEILLTLRLRRGDERLTLFATVTTFGTALDVTLDELSVEAFYPADAATARALEAAAAR
jgi:transcriptional regulator with XRE-family HTH domain